MEAKAENKAQARESAAQAPFQSDPNRLFVFGNPETQPQVSASAADPRYSQAFVQPTLNLKKDFSGSCAGDCAGEPSCSKVHTQSTSEAGIQTQGFWPPDYATNTLNRGGHCPGVDARTPTCPPTRESLYEHEQYCVLCNEFYIKGQMVCRLLCRHMLHDNCWNVQWRTVHEMFLKGERVEHMCPICGGDPIRISKLHYVDPAIITQDINPNPYRAGSEK